MAEIVRRRSWGGVLPLGRHFSISGSSLIQCASVSMAPPHPGWAKCYPGAKVQGRTGPKLSRECTRRGHLSQPSVRRALPDASDARLQVEIIQELFSVKRRMHDCPDFRTSEAEYGRVIS